MTDALGKTPPDVAIILGSGLGGVADHLQQPTSLPYVKVPGFPKTTIPGHEGVVLRGKIAGRSVVIFRGRFHYYEGHSLSIVTLPIRLLGKWGVRNLVVSNAAGSLRNDIPPGSLLFLRDHLNLIGQNPLRGPNLDELGPRFVDMSHAYDAEFLQHAQTVTQSLQIPFITGVYAALPGPSYETPSEIKMLATLGADVVGMSTVPEVIAARHMGMRVLGISCITNWASGLSGQTKPITHEEVIHETMRMKETFSRFLTEWIAKFPE